MHAYQTNNKLDTNARDSIEPSELFSALKENGVDFFCGVPDSLLEHFCAYVTDNAKNHTITANEGSAVGLAIGNYLATGKLPLVYMQNSGLGNAINPLLSLADSEVYAIPMLLMIGWRGQPGIKDEPQHIKQGRVMLAMLNAMEIPYVILPKNIEQAELVIHQACQRAVADKTPFAIIIEKDSFEPYKLQNAGANNYEISRLDAIATIVENIDKDDAIVSTTGFASRELFEYRQNNNQAHERDFLTVGGMGHTSAIALGVALGSGKNIYCIDGDGSLLMHMGSLATNGQAACSNFKHIVINNGAHHSVGGQETVGFKINLSEIARGCGYQNIYSVANHKQLIYSLEAIKNCEGPAFVEVRVNVKVSSNLGRPNTTPVQNKEALMGFLKK